jgi:hypothetical protein
MQIADIIKYENENTAVDFKATEYKKETFHELLKDVIAMANAYIDSEKYIICGVKLKGQEREILGLKNVTDSATYQQIISNNIEPELSIDYFPFDFNGITLGVLKISDCIDKPYMMKKDFGEKLKRGDCFIRKGSFTDRLLRTDLDNILNKRIKQSKFNGIVECFFSISNDCVLEVKVPRDVNFPSDIQKAKIEKIIREKEETLQKFDNTIKRTLVDIDIPMIGGTPYENRSLATLRQNLKNVKETYLDDDLYFLSKEVAKRINFTISNKGSEYLLDSTIEVIIEKAEGLIMLERIYAKPISAGLLTPIIPSTPSWDSMNYPKIIEEAKVYKIIESVGDIKHNVPQNALRVPFRIAFGANLVNSKISIKIFLHCKNLISPLSFDLTINCV